MYKLISVLKRTKISTKVNRPMQPNPHHHKFYDIAANLTDSQFGGHYYDDRIQVIRRARQYGCEHLLVAAGSLEDAYHSYQLCSHHGIYEQKVDDKILKRRNMHVTIGVHPCRAKEPFNKKKWNSIADYFKSVQEAIEKIHPFLVAIGQCGLDYDRLEWSNKEEQLEVFPHHFALAEKYKLPMYLHNRNTGNDFFDIVAKHRHQFTTGVVHSFTGTKEELDKILELDLYIGINGCSLKTQENLAVLKHIPLDRIMLETDSPYCEIRKSHKGSDLIKTKFQAKPKEKKVKGMLIKGRNEPCKIVQVLEVVSSVLEVDPDELAKQAYENSMKVLGPTYDDQL